MPQLDLTSPTQLKEILRRHNLRPKKRLGQCFLIDRNIVEKVVDALDIREGEPVLEIGPGVGTLTLALANRGAQVVAVELDEDMIDILHETLVEYPQVSIVHADFLRLDLKAFLAERFGDRKVKVVGNLPYYITTPIISALFTAENALERIVMMIQSEVADRLNATPGGREYGSMSIFVQYHAETEIVFPVPNSVFLPPPDVSSAVVRLTPHERPPVDVPSEKLYLDVVHCAFGRRRKTLLNSLTKCPPLNLTREQVSEILEKSEIDFMRRAETLSLEEFARIARTVVEESR